nr:DUF4214 domain-containing protein [Mesorhizobium opportunistum]
MKAHDIWRRPGKFDLMRAATKSSGFGVVGHLAAATICPWLCLWCLITTGASAADLLWGVNGHPFNAYPGISIEKQLDYVRDLGMRSYRVNISNVDSAARLAELIKAGRARGVEILPVITPELDLDHSTVDELYAQAYRLASTLVSRFKDDIRVWELGNEMENYAILLPCEIKDDGVQYSCAWGPASGMEKSDYFSPRWVKVSAVLRGLSDATIAIDPTIRKAMGTAGWGHRAAFTRMRQDGIRWDISVWHLYEGDPEEAFKFLATFGKPIWLTEFNYSEGSQRGESQQAEGLLETMNLLRKYHSSYDVQAAHIYELLDETYWAPSYEAFMGLVRLEKRGGGLWTPGGEKPAYEAVKKFIAGGKSGLVSPTVTTTSPMLSEQASDPSPGPVRAIHPCSIDTIDKSSLNPANRVAYAYCLLLHRMPSPIEQWSQVVALKTDPSISSTLLLILNSVEFRTGKLPAGLGNAKYVTFLYRVLLGREPDNNGLDSYLGKLSINKLTRQDVMAELINSYEFHSKHPCLFSNQQAVQ